MSVLVFLEINNKLSKLALEAITYGKSLGPVCIIILIKKNISGQASRH